MRCTSFLFATMLLLSCARIVTDPVDVPATVDMVDGSDVAELTPEISGTDLMGADRSGPVCPEGLDLENGLCHDPGKGNCGRYVPGPDTGGKMCRILHGAYFIGCDAGWDDCPEKCAEHCPGCWPGAQPITGATLAADVYLDRFEVTNRRYLEFLNDNETVLAPRCDKPEEDLWEGRTVPTELLDHPVVCVTAAEAEDFCEWAGKRLPTETEWEVGARAKGPEWNNYPWGDCFDTEAAQCRHEGPGDLTFNPLFHCKNLYAKDTCLDASSQNTCDETAPVVLGSGEPSIDKDCAWGLSHMAGNAAEWVADRWTENHGALDGCDAETLFCAAAKGDDRVVRGGSYEDIWEHITGWYRKQESAEARKRHIGFRCATD